MQSRVSFHVRLSSSGGAFFDRQGTKDAPAVYATATASRSAAARICTPTGTRTASRTAAVTRVIAATISGPAAPRRYGRSCMFSTITASSPASA